MMLARKAIVLALSCAGLLSACANQKPEPLTASSANQGGYAERYPDALASVRGGVTDNESTANRVMGEFSTFPDDLDNPSWDHVTTVVERADEAGKSQAYAERLEQNNAVVAFFSEEEREINNAVAGAVTYAAKQKGIDGEGLGGAATGGLKRAVDKRLEERIREYNEAHRYIEDNQEALGKKNVDKLKEQADKLSYVSYIVHVAVPQARLDLERMVDEGSQVKSTLDQTISEGNEVMNDANRAPADKEAAKKRVAEAEAAKAKVDSEVQQAQHVLTEIEQRQTKLQNDYDAALDALKQRIREKASAAKQ